MFVVTADQRRSTETGERVDALIEELTPWSARREKQIVLPLERTVGDEVQILLSSAEAAVDLALALCRTELWAVGIGAGAVERPLGASARASSGSAFIQARYAVERARSRTEPVPLVVQGDHQDAAVAATAVLQLLGGVVRRRADTGWEVSDLTAQGLSRAQIAEKLRITVSAVSQRARSAMLEEERRSRPVAAALISAAAGEGSWRIDPAQDQKGGHL
ncbi:hypothetical protein I2485_12990 [Nesterenkonia sp. E16_7]|uniref:hypothetical protein n=1 Tax=unclassified Nesterenkonia TaxID=2629769 RepID=UPI001A9346C7|nr:MULTISPECIES: hypothetical protein [unclassified Nesterenkonia]MBO0595843.1 hypothetical protein [Nesterenkonia sp. E16_10]MBO0599558.1 hypothetical protein [Nesterenkonia sp. E16_7]